ncbi:MAG TPA: SapC family protein [Burkholderiales bacterium]|nr:SapC family protein [Burkholderiales bacterium]
MDIAPPYGYGGIVPLRKDHRVALPEPGSAPAFSHVQHALPLSFAEFAIAARDYPLVFASGDGKSFAPMAVFGLQRGQNLFVLPEGLWDRRSYIPAYVRRFPFCTAKVTVDGKEQKERVVCCVEESALREDGVPLYDQAGSALPASEPIERLVLDFDRDFARAEQMCALLAELELFEPFSMKTTLSDGFIMQIDGMYRVRRAKLEALPEPSLRRLFGLEAMDKVYAHLMSLDNFRRLANRRSFFSAEPQRHARAN